MASTCDACGYHNLELKPGGGIPEEKRKKKITLYVKNIKNTPADGDTALDKFQGLVYSTAVTVPAKAIELYLDARRLIEEQVRSYTDPYTDKLLPDLLPQEQHVFTLVLDLNETLIHYIWTRDTGWQTFKRPGIDAFLEHLAQFYEIVVYTDEQNMFVDPVIERLDPKHCIRYRLSRPATKYQDGKHYRDLTKLNRNPAKVMYLNGHALESCLQPENCVPIKPWLQTDKDDTAHVDFIPFLEFVARSSPADIRPVLQSYQGSDIPSEFIRRSKEHMRKSQGQLPSMENDKILLQIINCPDNTSSYYSSRRNQRASSRVFWVTLKMMLYLLTLLVIAGLAYLMPRQELL